MNKLVLNNRSWSFDELRHGKFPDGLSHFETVVLTFCHEWLSGGEQFKMETSGSTGAPKEIFVKRTALESSARLTAAALGLRKGMTSLACLDTNYIAGRMMLVRSLVVGMDVIVTEPAANPLQNLPREPKIDFTALVPYQLERIIDSPGYAQKLNELHSILVGGAAVSEHLIQNIRKLKPTIYATYGMTETVSHIALQKLNGSDRQDMFQTLPGVVITKDKRGCLVIEADYLGSGRVITNDLVDIADHNHFRWLGRADNIINTGGVKIIPEKIEAEIGQLLIRMNVPNKFFIHGRPDDALGHRVVLVVEGELERKENILLLLKQKLSRFEVPKEIVNVERFARTATQKIDRKKVMDGLI